MKNLISKIHHFENLLINQSQNMLSIILRAYLFIIFWKSVQTKITGWTIFGQDLNVFNLTQSTFTLFEYEYELPLLPYELAAYLGTFAEFFLSLAILFGLLTRFAALALLSLTLVIQFFVYPDAWVTVHVFWALACIGLIKLGGGVLSIDKLICWLSKKVKP